MIALVVLTIAAVAGASIVVHDLQTDARSSAAPAATTTTAAGTSMSGMSMQGSGTTEVVGGKKTAGMPMAMRITPLGEATWQEMKIQARAMAPATFILLNGNHQQIVRPTAKDSFHLMVLLSDATNGVPIPYASVWATITKGRAAGGKPAFDERLWPMLSRYMGVHYGDNVPLGGAGTYRLTLLVSPPQAARHLEYKNLWLVPHRVSFVFRWHPSR